jgi:hypothetical protein
MLKVNTSTLTQLDLNDNDLGSSDRKGAEIIADALKVNPTLTHIDLVHTIILVVLVSLEHMPFAQALSQNYRTVHSPKSISPGIDWALKECVPSQKL